MAGKIGTTSVILKKWFHLGLIAYLLLFFISINRADAQQTPKKDANDLGYLEYLPPGYSENTDLYPVIIFLHGSGERGNGSAGDLEKLKSNGPPKLIRDGHNMCFEYNGVEECFIVLSPQTSRWTFVGYEIIPFVDYAIDNYRIDPSRVYLTGLSMGGEGTWKIAYSDENVPNRFAALSPIAGRGDQAKACKVAEDNTPVWLFHGDSDGAISYWQGRKPYLGMLDCNPDPVPIFTLYENVGHSGTWNRAYRTDNSLHTPNLYQWFLAQSMGEPALQSPTVDAGDDVSIILPENSVDLSATAVDGDGEITSILWARVSGPNTPAQSDLDQLNLTLSGLIEGSYSYSITVTDNDGLVDADQVTITVLPEPVNIPPTVDAGNNEVIVLPANFLTLNGSAIDSDGTIESIFWEQVSGPNTAGIVSSNDLSTEINNLIEGIYIFNLTVIDNESATSTDNVLVTVQPEPPNNPPIADAGNDLEITLPANSIIVSGSATDSDGIVESYSWVQSSGPNTAASSDLNVNEITINNLIQGSYVYTLTVTDDDGDSDSDQVTINVLPIPPNDPPVANAGDNEIITLPQNTFNLQGSATDSDGTIDSYLWEQQNGPNVASLMTPLTQDTDVTGLIDGIYTFSLTVTDNDGSFNTDNVQVTVLPEPPNEPPTVNGGADLDLTLPINSATLNATASDVDGTIESYQWEQISGPNTATSNTLNNQEANLSNLIEGVYQFTITVTDNEGASASDQVVLTVFADQNEVPEASAGIDISITLPTDEADLQGSATDSDGSIDVYSWTQITGPNTATIVEANSATTAVQNLIEGVYSFRFSVTDNDGATDTDQMNLTVLPQPINVPPTANAGEDLFLVLPNNSTTLFGGGTDSDGTIESYIWNVFDAGEGNIDDIVDFEVKDLAISGLEEGIYTFSLSVVDNDGAISASDQIRIFVNVPNSTPEADAGEDITITLTQSNASLNGSATDSDGEVTYTIWEQVGGPNIVNIADPLSLNTSISDLIVGVYTMNLNIEDNDGLVDNDQVRITVNPVPPNMPPNVNAGSDLQVSLPVNEVILNGSYTDGDGTVNSIQWSQLNGPIVLEGTNITTATPTFTGFIEGNYTLRFTAIDDDGAEGSDDIRITVLTVPGNQLPSANAGSNISITLPSNSVELNGNAFDVDGMISSYNWTQTQGPNIASLASEDQLTTSVNGLVEGIYTFRLTAFDNNGGEAFDQVNVRVNPQPANQPPNVIASNNQIINLPQTSGSLSATANDTDGTITSINWEQISGPSPSTLLSPTALDLQVEDLGLGTYVYRITVTDNSGVSSFDEVNIRILEALANQPPIVNSGTNQLIFAPENSAILSGEAIDNDGTISSSSWTNVSGPSTASITSSSDFTTEVNNLQVGTYVFRLEATDNQGLKGFDQLNVRVNASLPNMPPEAIAGDNVTLVLPENQTQLQGEAIDIDGTIQNIQWAQQFGPNQASLSGIDNLILQIDDLIAGFYVFRLTVTDNKGEIGFDDVSVTVNNALPIEPPLVDAGEDQSIILPVEEVRLSGQASTTVGIIEWISWEQLSGPSTSSILNSDNLEATVEDLEPGVYIFRLVAQSSEDLQNFDLVTITAKANQKPFAFSGADTTLLLPVTSMTLKGEGMDLDGTIEGVLWTQLDGPNNVVFGNPDQSITEISGFVEGTYVFQFIVTDNKGASAFDLLQVIVTSDGDDDDDDIAPVVEVGEDITVQLPKNSVELMGEAKDDDGTIIQYLWELIEGGEISFSTPDSSFTVVENLELGSYTFQLSVTDDDSLSSSDRLKVFVVAAEDEPVTSANFTKLFTPNGDGINDVWVSETLNNLNDCSLIVYNKLGVKIFEDTNYQNNWNGADQNGRILDEGAYFYLISCEGNFVKRGGIRIKK
ncbi:gliding motility-associated C-terminal domain-containing protein [Marivirga sericea]|uniref:Gliding motility-associated C-terminal domain-containing protein n=1 Tax=Marivirga sericea TaxID=1028 RepID=A0A1X7KMH7_9BACT|nr:gliding motility-associated C-terminal domain-containing protein [Marivirga sericea]SMG41916.1 gliding motility-associated C-terminal domain-containing protein [Marivirga sericea]